MRIRQSGGPWAGTVGAMRRLGREVTGPLRGNSKGGWALGCHKAGRVFVGLGPRSPLRHVPPSCSGGLAPHPLTHLPGAPARHHLGEPPAQRPHSSQEPSAILQACSPPPAPIQDAVLGPPSSPHHGCCEPSAILPGTHRTTPQPRSRMLSWAHLPVPSTVTSLAHHPHLRLARLPQC